MNDEIPQPTAAQMDAFRTAFADPEGKYDTDDDRIQATIQAVLNAGCETRETEWGVRYPSGKIVETFHVDPIDHVQALQSLGVDVSRVRRTVGAWEVQP